jgi:3-oxoacyl-[acyl-carrier protein] reductase
VAARGGLIDGVDRSGGRTRTHVGGEEGTNGGMKLEGKVALVTGAGQGIGKEIALAYAREGAKVGVNDKMKEQALSSAQEVRALGQEVLPVPADVSLERPVRDMVETMLREFGRIDVLVNNAGIFNQSRLVDMPVSTWDHMIQVNLRSVYLCTRFVLPSMVERRYGRIINVASQLGIKGAAKLAHYCAAKAGIIGFTKALALEVAEHNTTVNSIAPGPIETDLVIGEVSPDQIAAQIAELPLGRYGQVEEVAPTAVLLAAEPDGNLYTGQTLGPNAGDVMP